MLMNVPSRISTFLCSAQVLVTVWVASMLALGGVGTSGSAQTLVNRGDALLAKWNAQNMPGIAAALIRDGQMLYRKDVGMADLDSHTRITSNTQFLLGSMTKQFTAMAIMILQDRGMLRLEDSLATFCPEFTSAYARTITIRHLLNHTSGLPDFEELLLGGKVDYDKLPTRILARAQAAVNTIKP